MIDVEKQFLRLCTVQSNCLNPLEGQQQGKCRVVREKLFNVLESTNTKPKDRMLD